MILGKGDEGPGQKRDSGRKESWCSEDMKPCWAAKGGGQELRLGVYTEASGESGWVLRVELQLSRQRELIRFGDRWVHLLNPHFSKRFLCARRIARPASSEEAKGTVGIGIRQKFVGWLEGVNSQEAMAWATKMGGPNWWSGMNGMEW